MAGIIRRLAAGLSERFASAWVLLSDTTNFLSRTSVFPQYEAQLKELRLRLSSARSDDETIKRSRDELTELRKSLRLQGYDLTLGKLDLAVKGFRNDAAVVEGYRRMALFVGRGELWALSGEENHRALHDALDLELSRRGSGQVLHKHYLWYRWSNGLLSISGSDTETAADFAKLQEWCEQPENRLFLLSKLRRIR